MKEQKLAKSACLLLLITALLTACSGTVYGIGQPVTMDETIRDNNYNISTVSWSEEWASIKDDFEDTNQKTEIYSSSGELLLTLTDNEKIFYFTKNLEYDQWDYSVNVIPSNAIRLCSIVHHLERNGQFATDGQDTVYYDTDNFYMFTESASGITSQVKMSNKAAQYLIDLAGLDTSKGAPTFADERTGITSDAPANNGTKNEGSLPFAGLTYEGMLAASKVNRIDILANESIAESITNNDDIYNFLKALNTSDWSRVETIPDAANQICSIVFYQEGRKAYAGKMMEQWRQLVFYDGTNYYIDMLIADNGYGNSTNELSPERFLIPAEIGAMFIAE